MKFTAMRSGLEFGSADVASDTGPGDAAVPAASSPVTVWRPARRTRDSHLEPCRRCGALNGRSASSCWSCEADLTVRGPFAPVAPDPVDASSDHPVSLSTAPPLAEAGSTFPGSSPALQPDLPLAATPVLAAPARRRTPEIVAAIAVAVFAGAAASMFIAAGPDAAPVSRPVTLAARAVGVVAGPEPAAPLKAGPEPVAPMNAGPEPVAPRNADPEPAASTKAGPTPTAPPHADPNERVLPAAATDEPARAATRPAVTRPAAPKPERPGPARQASAALGPCTATVASLGLCAEPSSNAGAAPVPKPEAPERARPTSAAIGPCTAAVASLGLCAPPAHSRQ